MDDRDPSAGLPIWTIPLAPTGDHGSGFHTQNDPAQPFQRTNYIERTGAVEVRCSCVEVVHGFLDADGDAFCTLLVLEFRFDARKQARRICSIDIELRFDGLSSPNHPEVYAIAPCGNLSVAPTTQSESSTLSANIGLSPGTLSVAALNAGINYDRNVTRDMTYATKVTGATALRGRNFGPPNSASWTLLENPATKTGVPVAMKAAVLLKRQDEEQFQCIAMIKAHADWRSSLESVFGSTPPDDPVLFDPAMKPTSEAYDLLNLGRVDLGALSSITLNSVVPGDSDDDYNDSPTKAFIAPLLPQEDPAKEAFDRIIKDAENDMLILKTKANREEFSNKYRKHFNARIQPENQTLFHVVANRVGHTHLTYYLVRHHSQLLQIRDDSGKTPLYITIVRKNFNALGAILDKYSDDLDNLLAVACDHGRNSIHAAIFHNLDEAYTLRLIEKASEETLCMQDQDGLTPLHLAVQYSRCSESQLRIVRALIARGDRALDEFSTTPADLSVYRYHQYTRDKAEADLRASLEAVAGRKATGNSTTANRSSKMPEPDHLRGRDDERATGRPPNNHETNAHDIGLPQTGVSDEILSNGAEPDDWNLCFDYSKAPTPVYRSSFEQSFAHMHFDNVLRYVAFNKIELHSPPPRDTQLQIRKLALQPKPGRGRTDLTFFFNWLRNKQVDHILKVVVDDSPERPHSDKAIENCLKHFQVESLEWRKLDICPETLFNACRVVSHLHLWWSGNRAILRAWSEPEGLAKLENLKTITLLWNSAEVLEPVDVIQLYIKDFEARLARAVKSFELAKAGSNTRPLTQGIRRTNTGAEGIGNVEATPLRTILVEAIEENTPMNHNGAAPGGSRTKPLSTTNQRNLSAHRWLNCMDTFADEIQNVAVPPTQQDKLKRDITVALIDDGVNIGVPTVAGKVVGGATFDRGGPGENGPSPYFLSASGHGTVMADMICRVCPTAKLYVFKLETHATQDPITEGQAHNQIVTKSAALAVEASVARGVDIISISWTVKKPKDTEQDADLKDLGHAIKRALDAGILVFCAASDAGNFSDEEYPYDFDRNRIIRIGAATDDGRPWERSGDTKALSFIFPGCSVVSRNARLESAVPSHFRENTGSSVATALAAGLAALILHCVRLAAILNENDGQTAAPLEADNRRSLKDYRNMKAVFENIGVDREIHKFIEVWNRFEGPAEDLRLKKEQSSETIVKLALAFVSSKKH
ncbi:hypothetical protein F5Y10DRAFT_280401 [Nemania abortiva]|nr:hypothetical protein F5Y10DRAFT_280401 [Nemania abortiva]